MENKIKNSFFQSNERAEVINCSQLDQTALPNPKMVWLFSCFVFKFKKPKVIT